MFVKVYSYKNDNYYRGFGDRNQGGFGDGGPGWIHPCYANSRVSNHSDSE